jgi:ABC-type multidrug transport system fused ATPase/permease subunit
MSSWRERFAWLEVRPYQVLLVTLLGVASAVSEGIGIAMMLPVLEFADRGREVLQQESERWRLIADWYGALGIPLTLLTVMIPVFLLALLRQLFMYFRQMYGAVLQYRILERIQRQAFGGFVRADLSFASDLGVGRLMNAVTTDGQRAATAVQFFFDLIAIQVQVASYLIVLVALSGPTALIAIAIIGGIAWIVRGYMSSSRQQGEAISELSGDLQRALVELLGALRLVKLADREADAITRVDRLLGSLRERMLAVTRISGRSRMVIEPAAMLVLLATLFFAIELVSLSLARIGVFAIVMMRLVPLARSVLDTRHAMLSFLPSFENVQRLIANAEQARRIAGGPREFAGLQQELRFESVSFRYPNNRHHALENVTLSVPARTMTALVGHSGAGKSTMADLIPRLIEPTSGRILADGVPLEEFSLSSLRRQVAFVPQEGIVFDDTIANNIRYGRPDASEADVEQAARLARADEFIERLPLGYESQVGERGTRLSVGQRQRLSLARALLQRASLLILDEPTSALDSETEEGVRVSLEALRQEGRTTIIVIAHRLSTVYHADLIVVLDKGRVLECGTHHQLMHGEEWYARVMELQLLPEPAPTGSRG